YVTDLTPTSGGAGKVLRYNPDGSFDSVFIASVAASPAAFPSDGLFTADGRFLTANLGTSTNPAKLTGSVSQFTSSGTAITPTLTPIPSPPHTVGTTPNITNIGATQLTQNAGNVAPSSPSGGSAYSIDVGQGLTLSASATAAPGNTLTYSWDING